MSSRRLVLSLLVAPVVALAPLPAHAETVTTKDAARDVVSLNYDGEPQSTPEPTRDEGDTLSMRVTHGNGAVRIRLRAAQLTRDPSQTAVHVFALRTNEGRRADLALVVDGGRWQGQRMWMVDDRERPCRGLRTRIDYRAGTVQVKVPRKCLSDPRWVRVGGGIGIDDSTQLHADDVSRAGKVGHELALGPRVRRG